MTKASFSRAIRAEPPSITRSTSAREAVLVSPGVVIASAPWATPQATAQAAGFPISIPKIRPEANESPPPTRSMMSISRCGTYKISSRRWPSRPMHCGKRFGRCARWWPPASDYRTKQRPHAASSRNWQPATHRNLLSRPSSLIPSMAEKSSSLPKRTSSFFTNSRFTSCAFVFPPMDFQRESR